MSKNIGRPSNDINKIIEELKKRTPSSTYKSVSQLKEAFPDLQAQLKTLENKAQSVFGMSLGK